MRAEILSCCCSQGMEEAVIERKQGPDGAMSLTFTHQQRQVNSLPPCRQQNVLALTFGQQLGLKTAAPRGILEVKCGRGGVQTITRQHQSKRPSGASTVLMKLKPHIMSPCCVQAPHHSSSPPGTGFLADGRPALQRTSAPGPMAGPFHQAQRAQQARLQHIAQQRQTALVKQAQEQVRGAMGSYTVILPWSLLNAIPFSLSSGVAFKFSCRCPRDNVAGEVTFAVGVPVSCDKDAHVHVTGLISTTTLTFGTTIGTRASCRVCGQLDGCWCRG